MTNLTLRKKDTTTNDFCYLVIKGDVNDSDYIEESTLLNNKELDEILPYVPIVQELFDPSYRSPWRKNKSYTISARDSPKLFFEEWLEKESVYKDLLEEKKVNGWDIFSTNMQKVSESDFKEFYEQVVNDVRDFLSKEVYGILPSYSDYIIHTITDAYIEKNDEKYDINGDWFSAFGELMENKAIAKYNWQIEKEKKEGK